MYDEIRLKNLRDAVENPSVASIAVDDAKFLLHWLDKMVGQAHALRVALDKEAPDLTWEKRRSGNQKDLIRMYTDVRSRR